MRTMISGVLILILWGAAQARSPGLDNPRPGSDNALR